MKIWPAGNDMWKIRKFLLYILAQYIDLFLAKIFTKNI